LNEKQVLQKILNTLNRKRFVLYLLLAFLAGVASTKAPLPVASMITKLVVRP
jgi:hypothetical protein